MLLVLVLATVLVTVLAVIVYGVVYKTPATSVDNCVVLERHILPGGDILELVSDDCQEGLPHTTGPNTIRMTRSIYESDRRVSILTHERIHLDQKRRPDAWAQFTNSAWSYELTTVRPSGLPATYELRPNPDTSANPYAVWRGRYVFFSAYDATHRLSSAPVIIYDLKEGRALPAPPPEWKAHFCTTTGRCPHQYEHPYEIAAEYATHKMETPAAAQLMAWMK
jgi:hypothetical protein